MTTTKEQRTRSGFLLLELSAAGADSFLVNVIQVHHRNPVRKLRGLLRLMLTGNCARVSQFDIDILLVNGERTAWAALETA